MFEAITELLTSQGERRMKFNFVKLVFALSALGFATTGYTQPPISSMGPEPVANNYGINALNSIRGWHINGAAVYDRFSNNGTNYARNFTATTLVGTNRYHNINARNHWGWDAGIGYYIDCADMDFNFDYFIINTSDTSSVTGPAVFPISDTVLIGASDVASGEARFSYSTAALTAGHQVRLTPVFSLFYYGGVRYGHYSRNISIDASMPGRDIDLNRGVSFNGYGPTFGINGETYPFYYFEFPGFSISGGIQTSFLYGNLKSSSRDFVTDFLALNHFPTTKIVAPILSGSLALNYLWMINGWGLKTTLGYQDTVLFGVNKTDGNLVAETNASFQGFYLNFTLRF